MQEHHTMNLESHKSQTSPARHLL